MLHKSTAICLSYIPYRDSSVIARFFTENRGLQSFIASGVRSAKTRFPPSLFQPLCPVEIVHYLNPQKDLHRLSEIRPLFILSGMPLHPAKSAIAMFAAEYLSKVLKEHLENAPFFSLVLNWIRELDRADSQFESAHLGLVWHSFSFLGIAPEDWKQLFTGNFLPFPDEEKGLDVFFQSDNPFEALKMPSNRRQLVLDALINFAAAQMEGMGEMKSLPVLRRIFA